MIIIVIDNYDYCEMIISKGDTEEHIRMYVNADDTIICRILDCVVNIFLVTL